MKEKVSIRNCLFIAILFLLSVAVVPITIAGGDKELESQVVSLDGAARYSRGTNQAWNALRVCDIVQTGSTIQTAEKSSVSLFLGRVCPTVASLQVARDIQFHPTNYANYLKLFPSSILKIDSAFEHHAHGVKHPVEDYELEIAGGQFMITATRVSKNSCITVKSHDCIVKAGPSCFVASSSGVFYVLSGKISVMATNASKTWEVAAGYYLNLLSDKTNPIPHPIPPFTSEGPEYPFRCDCGAIASSPEFPPHWPPRRKL